MIRIACLVALLGVGCSDNTQIADASVDRGPDGNGTIEVCDGVDNDNDTQIDEGAAGIWRWIGGGAGPVAPLFFEVPAPILSPASFRFFVMNEADPTIGLEQNVYALEFDVGDYFGLYQGPGAAYTSHILRLSETDPSKGSTFTFRTAPPFAIPFGQFKSMALNNDVIPGYGPALAFLGPDGERVYVLEHDPDSIPAEPNPKAIMNAGRWSVIEIDKHYDMANYTNPGPADAVFFARIDNVPYMTTFVGDWAYLIAMPDPANPTASPSVAAIPIDQLFFAGFEAAPSPPLSAVYSAQHLQVFFIAQAGSLYVGGALPTDPPHPGDGGLPDAGVDSAAPTGLVLEWSRGPTLEGYVRCKAPPPPL